MTTPVEIGAADSGTQTFHPAATAVLPRVDGRTAHPLAEVLADGIKIDGASAERNRITAITNYCRDHRIDEKLQRKWIANGTDVESV